MSSSWQPQRTDEGLFLLTINRFPKGYTVYPTGVADDIVNGVYGAGDVLLLDADNKTKVWRALCPYFAFGGRAIWEGADLDDSISGMLKAPASGGLTNAVGDYTKIATGLGFNIIVPTPPGAGDWDMDLTELYPNTDILKATPVPVANKKNPDGFFDFDIDTNILTVNAEQKGLYNLYDAELPMFAFCRQCFGRKQDGAETMLEAEGVIGKKLLNNWSIEFTLNTAKLVGIKVGIMLNTAVKENV